MLMKLILFLQLTLSLHGEKIRKTKSLHKSGGPQGDGILRRLKKGGLNDRFRNESWRPKTLVGYLPRIINFYGLATFDTLALFTIMLFLLKKFLLFLIPVIWRLLKSLSNEDINGN